MQQGPNKLRGYVDIEIEGQVEQLRYTMGAMRELREHFKVASAEEIFANAKGWSPEDLVFLIAAGLRRGSLPDVRIEELEDKLLFSDMKFYMESVGQAFGASNLGDKKAPKKKKAAKGAAQPF